MNSKRQTIWLVSMLSLMVVLSAYYLFTEDSNSPNLLTDGSDFGEHSDHTLGDTTGDNQVQVDEVITEEEPEDASTDEPLGWNENGGSKTDDEILQEWESKGMVQDVFAEYGMKRYETTTRAAERLYDIIGDSSQSVEAHSKAHEELQALEEKEIKLTNLEAQLMEDYDQVIVTEDGDNVRVVVQSPNLERSQAVTIVDMVMKEMKVTQDKVSVQVVK